MAFKLECTTSVEALLVVAGLEPARHLILRQLVLYIVRRHRADLGEFSGIFFSSGRVTPFELGATWFHRSVQGTTLSDSALHLR